jgi:hypothetical protein
MSIMQARLVTMGAIDPLLCEEVLGQVTWQNQTEIVYIHWVISMLVLVSVFAVQNVH